MLQPLKDKWLKTAVFNCLGSSDEPFCFLQEKISPSLKQALEKLKLTEENAQEIKGKNNPTILFPTFLYLSFTLMHFILFLVL